MSRQTPGNDDNSEPRGYRVDGEESGESNDAAYSEGPEISEYYNEAASENMSRGSFGGPQASRSKNERFDSRNKQPGRGSENLTFKSGPKNPPGHQNKQNQHQHQNQNQNQNQHQNQNQNQAKGVKFDRNTTTRVFDTTTGKHVNPVAAPHKPGEKAPAQNPNQKNKGQKLSFTTQMYGHKEIINDSKHLKLMEYPVFCKNVLYLLNIYNWKSNSDPAIKFRALEAIITLYEFMRLHGADSSKYRPLGQSIFDSNAKLIAKSEADMLTIVKLIIKNIDIYKNNNFGFPTFEEATKFVAGVFAGEDNKYLPADKIFPSNLTDVIFESPPALDEKEILAKPLSYFNNIRCTLDKTGKLVFDPDMLTVLYSMVAYNEVPDNVVAQIIGKFQDKLNLNYVVSAAKGKFINYVVKNDYFLTLASLVAYNISVDINAKSQSGETMCAIAIRKKSNRILDILLRFPNLRLGQQDNEGKNELVIAFEENNVFAVNRLMERDRGLKMFLSYTHKTQTILTHAILASFSSESLKIANAIPNFILVSDEYGMNPLSLLMQKCNPDLDKYFQILVQKSPLKIDKLKYIDDHNNSFLLLFLKYNFYDQAKNIISLKPASLNNISSYTFNWDLNLLCSFNYSGESPLSLIIKKGYIELYELILSRYQSELFSINNFNNIGPHVFLAIRYPNVGMPILENFLHRAKELMKDLLDNDGNNLLAYAIIQKNESCIKTIIEAAKNADSADPNKSVLVTMWAQRNKFDQNAIFLATANSISHVWDDFFSSNVQKISMDIEDFRADVIFQHNLLTLGLRLNDCKIINKYLNSVLSTDKTRAILNNKYGVEKITPMFWGVLTGVEEIAIKLATDNPENELIGEKHGLYEGINIFQAACRLKMPRVTKLLATTFYTRRYDSTIDSTNHISIFDAIQNGLSDTAIEIFSKQVTPNEQFYPPFEKTQLPGTDSIQNVLIWAIIYGMNDLIQYVLNKLETFGPSTSDRILSLMDREKKTIYDYSLLFSLDSRLKDIINNKTLPAVKTASNKYLNLFTILDAQYRTMKNLNTSLTPVVPSTDIQGYTLMEFQEYRTGETYGTSLMSGEQVDYFKNIYMDDCTSIGIRGGFKKLYQLFQKESVPKIYRFIHVRRSSTLYEYVLIEFPEKIQTTDPEAVLVGSGGTLQLFSSNKYVFTEVVNPKHTNSLRMFNKKTNSYESKICRTIGLYKVFKFKELLSLTENSSESVKINVFNDTLMDVFLMQNKQLFIILTEEQKRRLLTPTTEAITIRKNQNITYWDLKFLTHFSTFAEASYKDRNNRKRYLFIYARSFNRILRDPYINYVKITNLSVADEHYHDLEEAYCDIAPYYDSPILELETFVDQVISYLPDTKNIFKTDPIPARQFPIV